MKCIVTAGPTYEPLDAVRRLTNLSTGRLGCELAAFLSDRGHEVTLLVGEQATWPGERRAGRVISFTTTASLHDTLRELSAAPTDAVFHTAAVSDFRVGKVWAGDEGHPVEVEGKKIPTRHARLLAELLPTPKILPQLRDWLPKARLVGWKYEIEGGQADAILAAERQLRQCRTDACVVNGRAYGDGFGWVTRGTLPTHFGDVTALYRALDRFLHR
jgi:phosphopantothenoylcysteine decarboxylase/phosphopantothenate--cysteine ligase